MKNNHTIFESVLNNHIKYYDVIYKDKKIMVKYFDTYLTIKEAKDMFNRIFDINDDSFIFNYISKKRDEMFGDFNNFKHKLKIRLTMFGWDVYFDETIVDEDFVFGIYGSEKAKQYVIWLENKIIDESQKIMFRNNLTQNENSFYI